MCEICIYIHQTPLSFHDISKRMKRNKKWSRCVWHIRNFTTAARVRATDAENFYSSFDFFFVCVCLCWLLLQANTRTIFIRQTCIKNGSMMTYLCVWNFLNLKISFSDISSTNIFRVSHSFDMSSCLYLRQMLGNSWMYAFEKSFYSRISVWIRCVIIVATHTNKSTFACACVCVCDNVINLVPQCFWVLLSQQFFVVITVTDTSYFVLFGSVVYYHAEQILEKDYFRIIFIFHLCLSISLTLS